MSAIDDVNEQISRKASVQTATLAGDLEQKRRVNENQEGAEWDEAERRANQRRASKMLDAEQARRTIEAAGEEKQAEEEVSIIALMLSWF